MASSKEPLRSWTSHFSLFSACASERSSTAPYYAIQGMMSTDFRRCFALFLARVCLCRAAVLCHACTYGKQRQRQKRTEEGAQAEAKTGTGAEARSVHADAGPVQVRRTRAAVYAQPHCAQPTHKGPPCRGGPLCVCLLADFLFRLLTICPHRAAPLLVAK